MEQKFKVTGMSCSACSASVEKAVKKLNGVNSVNVNLLSNSMAVEYDEAATDSGVIIGAVENAGYGAALYEKTPENQSAGKKQANPVEDEIRDMRRRLIISICFLVPLMYVSMGHMLGLPLPMWLHGAENAVTFAFAQFLLAIPVVYINRKFFQVGFKALWRRSPNMDSLIAIGSTAAVIYGIFAIFMIGHGLGHGLTDIVEQYSMDLYFESAATILTLITLGKFLETLSKGKTSEAISKLLDLTPKTATVVRDGKEEEIPVEQVAVGDIVVVRPGQSIPVDGVIVEGSSAVDQSALTGESIPVEKGPGDKVITATINKNGFFRFRAEKVGKETAFAKIVELVEEASSSKAPISKLADKISGIFVPAVMAVALAATAIWLIAGEPSDFALSIGIAVLVISCPCALGLATPVAIMVGTGKGATHGILIKSAEALERAHTVSTVVLDKTGTLTEGKPVVTDIAVAESVTEKRLMKIAASVELSSEHPLADAIAEKARAAGIGPGQVTMFSAVGGRGLTALMDGKKYAAGNAAMMEENNVDISALRGKAETFAEEGKTPLYFAEESKLLGVIAVADIEKPTSREAVARMKEMGLDVIMLTGDNRVTAEAIRKRLGIDRVLAEVMPEDKEREIRRLQEQGEKVAMIGDGINDAPALARADVGIAIGAGTDVAIESADIVLVRNDLLDAAAAIRLSKATMRTIRQNLFWAFFYNVIGIPIAAGALYPLWALKLSPMIAAAAMSFSSVFVVLNALRLRFFKPLRKGKRQNFGRAEKASK